MHAILRHSVLKAFDFATRRTVHAVPPDGWHVRKETIMGTAVRVELHGEDSAAGDSATAAVMREMHRIDAMTNPHKPLSELSRINREAGRRAVPLSDEMFRWITRAIDFSDVSDGAFDITFASVGFLCDDRAGIAPTAKVLAKAREAIGWHHLELDAEAQTLRFTHPGTRIDLGGFAKGLAMDNAVRLLQQRGVAHAMVSAGGDCRVLGDCRGRPWTIGIRDPRRPGERICELPLEDTAISTAGDPARCIQRDGLRHHRVLDPHTGRRAGRVLSVTVLAPNALTSDALSKALCVLGARDGLALVDRMPGVDAVVVDAAGSLHCSSGFLRP